ncbi:MAG TPA: SMI1/KNR4 family protein [Blastocatellia bacterium]|nr:SMI1/KNR4 family protein [Blastocatellia bacterium]
MDHLLSQPDRRWQGEPPATEEEIARLVQACDAELPQEYLSLLRYSNGGEGPLALAPLVFVLYRVNDTIGMMADQFYRGEFPAYRFFGGNGGLELLAFDLRNGSPYPIVMIDPIAGSESAVEIAPSFAKFCEAIGLECDDPHDA